MQLIQGLFFFSIPLFPLPLRKKFFTIADVEMTTVKHLLHFQRGVEAEFGLTDVIYRAIVRTHLCLAIDHGTQGSYSGNVDGMTG